MDAPLIITPEVEDGLKALRDLAARRPLDVQAVLRSLGTGAGRKRHQDRMAERTMGIPGPLPFHVTFSIETGHPGGTMRHLSMSIRREARVPSPEAVWMVAQHLGFVMGLRACRHWMEDLESGGHAVNLIQPLAVHPEVRDA